MYGAGPSLRRILRYRQWFGSDIDYQLQYFLHFRGISGATGVPVVACALGPTLQLTADSVIPAEAMPYNEEHLGTVL